MAKLTWNDIDELGFRLSETHSGVDPLAVRFTDLHRWITELPGFSDDPKASTEKKLEAIQMAWREYFLDDA